MTVTRRSTVAVVSVLLHLTVLAVLMLISVLAPDLLPAPHSRALAWTQPQRVHLADIELKPETQPKAKANTPSARSALPAPTPVEQVPFVASDGIRPETGREGGALLTGPAAPGVTAGIADANLGHVESAPLIPTMKAPVRLHSGIAAPRRILDVSPIYPAMAKASHVEGMVIIEATISDNGDVVSARVLRSVPLLDDAALNAVRRWRFEPARLNGEAIPVVMTVTVNFRLN